jgi:hypothetical protein
MPDAELFGLVGLPPYPTRQQFEVSLAEDSPGNAEQP